MLKNLHKIFYIFCLISFLGITQPSNADVNTNALKNITAEQMNFVQQDVKVNDLDIEPLNTQNVKKDVVPDTHKEGKKVFSYFLRIMLLVAFCSIVAYLVLFLIKKYNGSAYVNWQEEDCPEAFDLSTPDTKQDALKIFLNRTK